MFFAIGVLLTLVLFELRKRNWFLEVTPMMLKPMRARDYEMDFWAKTSNAHFDTENLQISNERYRNLSAASPESFRILRNNATGEIVGGYAFLFFNGDIAQHVMSGQIFMVDVTSDMVCKPSEATLMMLCDVVVKSDRKRVLDILSFDIYSQIIATNKVLSKLQNITATSVDPFYESFLSQINFTHRPIPAVERTGRKLWVADASHFRGLTWEIFGADA
jgi:hypothetical protein